MANKKEIKISGGEPPSEEHPFRVQPTVEKQVETEKSVETENSAEKSDMQELLDKVESLEEDRKKDKDKIDMLTAVADKGRMFNYESKKAPTKKPMKVQLAKFEDKILIGWRTIKDILVKNPTTGLTVGEEQEFEIVLLDSEGNTQKEIIQGYPRFSSIRYDERIEVEVVGKSEDYEGKITFEVVLPDGRQISLDSRFVN